MDFLTENEQSFLGTFNGLPGFVQEKVNVNKWSDNITKNAHNMEFNENPPGLFKKKQYTQTDLYQMPPNLCRDLVQAITTQVNGTPELQSADSSADSVASLSGLH